MKSLSGGGPDYPQPWHLNPRLGEDEAPILTAQGPSSSQFCAEQGPSSAEGFPHGPSSVLDVPDIPQGGLV